MLTNLADVCAHFEASEVTNESLSRRVYKNTSCGAWAKVIERPRLETREETWGVRYANIDGWTVVSASRDGTAVELSALPKNVADYFLIGAEHQAIRTNSLPDLAKGDSAYTATEKLVGEYPVGVESVFLVGSIVEGTDAEVQAEEVVLPADESAVDAAVQAVEDGATEIWTDTHGCEGCAALAEEPWQPGATHVHEDCKQCDGTGMVV